MTHDGTHCVSQRAMKVVLSSKWDPGSRGFTLCTRLWRVFNSLKNLLAVRFTKYSCGFRVFAVLYTAVLFDMSQRSCVDTSVRWVATGGAVCSDIVSPQSTLPQSQLGLCKQDATQCWCLKIWANWYQYMRFNEVCLILSREKPKSAVLFCRAEILRKVLVRIAEVQRIVIGNQIPEQSVFVFRRADKSDQTETIWSFSEERSEWNEGVSSESPAFKCARCLELLGSAPIRLSIKRAQARTELAVLAAHTRPCTPQCSVPIHDPKRTQGSPRGMARPSAIRRQKTQGSLATVVNIKGVNVRRPHGSKVLCIASWLLLTAPDRNKSTGSVWWMIDPGDPLKSGWALLVRTGNWPFSSAVFFGQGGPR